MMSSRKRWRDEEAQLHDEAIVLLKAVIAFKRENGGATPSLSTMRPFYDAVKPHLPRRLDIRQVYSRIHSLKKCYRKMMHSGVGGIGLDGEFWDLSREAWGQLEPWKGKGGEFEIMGEELRRYLEKEKSGDVGVLEMGMKFVNRSKAVWLEKKWRKLLEEEVSITRSAFRLKSDICRALEDSDGDEGL